MNFEKVEHIFSHLADLFEPPERLGVADFARKYRFVNQPGAYVGPWKNSTVWYMVEPMNECVSRDYTGLIFVGPAQSAKTDSLVVNFIAYRIKVDPLDTMLVCPSQGAARDFSMRRIDRLHRDSKAVGGMLMTRSDADNTFDKHYINGMLLTLSWPTPIELAGKPIGCVILTDRDRMVDDVDGDGEPFDLAAKRTTTFGSYAMTVCESSPSREVKNLKWIRRTPHEAPPAAGILALYNRGDKRRWYWPCPSEACGQYFEGDFDHLIYPGKSAGTNLDRAEQVRMKCPICGHLIHPDEREDMQFYGRWVRDGQMIDKDGIIHGPNPRALIASFWLKGVAAAFVSWKKLVAMYLDAYDEFETTGSEEALKKFYNNDLGEPYYPKHTSDLRLPESIKSRAEKVPDELVRHVPLGVRFLVATVDVQKNMFVVQVFGILPGMPFDTYLVDRFDIRKAKRLDHEDQPYFVRPGSYLEDWDRITELVLDREYPLADGSGRLMGIKMTGCDSGGEAGVTEMAYNYYRSLRNENKHRRFILMKGEGKPNQPRTRLTHPDSNQRGMKAIARGDVPVLFLNSNLLKDSVDKRLDCMEPGKGMYRTPDWLSDSFYGELCVEVRTVEKGWQNMSKARNEAWDLSYYCIGLCVSEFVMAERLDWQNPPSWASDWDTNDFVRKAEEPPAFAQPVESKYDFGQLGSKLAS